MIEPSEPEVYTRRFSPPERMSTDWGHCQSSCKCEVGCAKRSLAPDIVFQPRRLGMSDGSSFHFHTRLSSKVCWKKLCGSGAQPVTHLLFTQKGFTNIRVGRFSAPVMLFWFPRNNVLVSVSPVALSNSKVFFTI